MSLGFDPAGDLPREVVDRLGGGLLHGEVDLDDPPDGSRVVQCHLAPLIGTPKVGKHNSGTSTVVGIARIIRQLDVTELHRL